MWLALAIGAAFIAVALAVATAAASVLVAFVGVPIAAYSAIAHISRVGLIASLFALATDLCVLGYWAFVLVDALQGVR